MYSGSYGCWTLDEAQNHNTQESKTIDDDDGMQSKTRLYVWVCTRAYVKGERGGEKKVRFFRRPELEQLICSVGGIIRQKYLQSLACRMYKI